MIDSRVSSEREFQKTNLLKTCKNVYQDFPTPFLYLQKRASHIVTAFAGQSHFFSVGFSKIMSEDKVPEDLMDRVVLITVIAGQAIDQIERYCHLFGEIFIINLSISAEETKETIRVSPFRKKIRGFLEISLNFIPFIDEVYYSNIITKSNHQDSFEESLSSLLLSFPKFYEFQFNQHRTYPKYSGLRLKQMMQKKLTILQTHGSKQFRSVSTPRIKVLLVDRSLDRMSPFLYSFHFGPISQQLKALDKNMTQFTINSTLYTKLFPLDLKESNDFLTNIANDKASNQKEQFQLHEFDQAKKKITKHFDQNTSPQQIELQIQMLNVVNQFAKKRKYTTALQQTLVNGVSQMGVKMVPGKVVDHIVDWSTLSPQQSKPSEEDYIKILILSYMVNSFWFWQKKIINAGLNKDNKDKIVKVCKKVQGKSQLLNEKIQGEERLDYYRHQPSIIEVVRKWIQKDQSQHYNQWKINQSSVNKDSKMIIAIKGPVGYGQLALLLRQLKKIDNKNQYIIFCSSLVTTQQYLNVFLEQNKA